jgi:glycosyltransferase involved in cell wall biosynthesis
VRFLTETPYRHWKLALVGVGRRLRARRVRMLADRLRWRVYRTIRGTRRIFSIEGGVIGWIYDAIARRFEWWPFAWGGRERVRARIGQHPHVGYVIWHYPTLSETFIRREIHALRRLGAGAGGIVVDVLADGPDAPDLDPDPPSPRGETAYLEPHRIHRLRRFALRLFLRHPLRFINLALYLVTHRYGPRKRLQNDFLDFRRAVELARLAEERGVTHLHAPWADAHAVLARVAARLLDLPYSVQARAHEIHSETFNVGLREKLDGARFIVTNSRFNEGHLRGLLGQEAAARLHVIFNGVQLIQFEPSPPPAPLDSSRPIRLLSVGRLVEQTGF